MAVRGGRHCGDGRGRGGGQRVPVGVSQGSKMEELEGRAVPQATPAFPQCLLGPRGAPDHIFPALRCPHAPPPLPQFSMGCPAGGNVAKGLPPSAGSGCPSSVAPGAQSTAATTSTLPAGGLGDGGASWLWRCAGWGGSGGGTEGARLGAPAIRRGRALGLAACSGAAGAGAVLQGWAMGGGGIVGRAGARRLPGKKAGVGWGPLRRGLSPGQRGLRCRPWVRQGAAGRLTDKLPLARLPYWRPKRRTAFGGFSHPLPFTRGREL